jgi:hypothetical protein
LASRLLGGFFSAAADATVPVWLALIQIRYFHYTRSERRGALLRDATILYCFVSRAKIAPKFLDPSGGGFFQICYANLLGRASLRTCFTSTKEGIA